MREQLLFDVPMIGLAAAAVVNPLFNGAKNTTLDSGWVRRPLAADAYISDHKPRSRPTIRPL